MFNYAIVFSVFLAFVAANELEPSRCKSGYYKNNTSDKLNDMTWNCIPCPSGTIPSDDQLRCLILCRTNWRLNDPSINCIDSPKRLTEITEWTIIVCGPIVILGFCASTIMLFLMIGEDNSRQIENNERILKSIYLFGLILAHVSSFDIMFFINDPTPITCAFRQLMPQICYTVMFSSFLAMILDRPSRVLIEIKNPLMPLSTLITIILYLITIGIVIGGILLVLEPPTIYKYSLSEGPSFSYCRITKASTLLPFGYNIIILGACLVHYFKGFSIYQNLRKDGHYWNDISTGVWIICPIFVVSSFNYKENKVSFIHFGMSIVSIVLLIIYVLSMIRDRRARIKQSCAIIEDDSVSHTSNMSIELKVNNKH